MGQVVRAVRTGQEVQVLYLEVGEVVLGAAY